MTEKPAAGPAPATPSTPDEPLTHTATPAAPAPAESAGEPTKRTRNWPVITAAVAGGIAVTALAFGGGLATGWNLNPGPESGLEFTDGSQMPEESGPGGGGSDERRGPHGHDHPSESRDHDRSGPSDGSGPRGGDDIDDRGGMTPEDEADTDRPEHREHPDKDDADRDADQREEADSDAA